MGTRRQSEVVKLGGRYFYWPNHLTGPNGLLRWESPDSQSLLHQRYCDEESQGGSYCPPTSLAYRETYSFNLCLCMGICMCAWASQRTALDDCYSLGPTHLYFFLGVFGVDLRSCQHFTNRTVSLAPPITSGISEFHPIFVSAPAS